MLVTFRHSQTCAKTVFCSIVKTTNNNILRITFIAHSFMLFVGIFDNNINSCITSITTEKPVSESFSFAEKVCVQRGVGNWGLGVGCWVLDFCYWPLAVSYWLLVTSVPLRPARGLVRLCGQCGKRAAGDGGAICAESVHCGGKGSDYQ